MLDDALGFEGGLAVDFGSAPRLHPVPAARGASAAGPQALELSMASLRDVERDDKRILDAREASALSLTERRYRDEAERLVRMQQVRLGAARQARIAAEQAAVEQAASLALAEAEQLAQAEAALSNASAAVRQARNELERLARIEGECRTRADAQRSRAVQARLAARALSLRHAAVNAAPGMDTSSADGFMSGGAAGPAEAAGGPETGGFAPTMLQVPDDSAGATGATPKAPILTVVPLDRPAWGEAANRPRMGTVLVEGQRLTPVDVEVVLMHQAAQRRRFGEIAVSLGLLEVSDVVWALRRQRPDGNAAGGRGASPLPEALVMRDRPDSPAAAVIRRIASQLGERLEAQPTREALSIVSAAVGDGKSTVAANLALAMAERGRRVLLIDTDLVRSRMALMLPGLERSKGLSGVLAGRQRLADAIVPVPMTWPVPMPSGQAAPTLPHVLPAGENLGDPNQLASLPTFSKLLEKVVAHYDQVLLDTPAATHGSGALRLACLTGPALVVARPGHTRTAELDALTRSLSQAGATVMGVVMNSH